MSRPLDDMIQVTADKGVDPREIEYLRVMRTANSVTIPKEVFERHYPALPQRRTLARNMFGNPFPMALMGFLMASTPLGCTLMGWRGAGGQGAALVGVFYFFGGMLQIIGAVMEWIIGNTFPFVVFVSYGAFWLSLGATLTPSYNALGAYVDSDANASSQAAGQAEYYNTYAFFFMIMTVLTFIYVLASVRTNVILVITFFFIDMAFFMLMSSYSVAAEGRTVASKGLQVAAGAFIFTFCMSDWYLFLSLVLEALDFPFTLPLGDLSERFPSATGRRKRTNEYENGTSEQDGDAGKQA